MVSGAPCRNRRPASEEGPWREPCAAEHLDAATAGFLPQGFDKPCALLARWVERSAYDEVAISPES